MNSSFRHYPLGETVPASPHAVVSSLPTMADVCGYEEKLPEVMDALKSGYPRFVMHSFIRDLLQLFSARLNLGNRVALALIPGRRASEDLQRFVGRGLGIEEVEPALFLVHADENDAELALRVWKFVQHTGCGISSRQAEDCLLRYGKLSACHAEPLFPGNAERAVETQFAELCGCRARDVLVCASGMNAFYAGFRAIQDFQRTRGRRHWIQLGWLYVDSGAILEKFIDPEECVEHCYDVQDTDALIAHIEATEDSLAGVVLECPTNPLVQVADLARVSEAVRRNGGVLMVDPTMASVYNVSVLPFCDLLVTSLTKYASYRGDVMIGALALNPHSNFYGDLVLRTSAFHQAPYPRDLARLAGSMQDAPQLVAKMNQNAVRLARYLKGHEAVERIHFAADEPRFEALTKEPGCAGAVISLVLKGNMATFYDALRLVKGPSFGTSFSMVSPFMYLAHYELVKSARGRDFLAQVGIDPELIRISVGTESYETIESVFDEAFKIAAKSRVG